MLHSLFSLLYEKDSIFVFNQTLNSNNHHVISEIYLLIQLVHCLIKTLNPKRLILNFLKNSLKYNKY
jgi:hypothetical protein